MNRLILSLALIFSPLALLSQLPTEPFESWDNKGGVDYPTGWTPSAFGIGKSSASHSGAYAVTVWNWYYYGKGYIITGVGNGFYADLIHSGIPINYKPNRLSGYYKFVPDSVHSTNDSAMILIMLKRFDPQKQVADTVAYVMQLLAPASAYTPFSIDIPDRAPGVMPDSIVIALVSSANGSCAGESSGNCCYFTVDDLTLASTSGVHYSVDWMLRPLRIYPNPARSSMRLEWNAKPGQVYHALIYSADGRLVQRIDNVTDGVMNVDRSGWASGAYLFEIRDGGERIAGRGRVVVE